MQLPFADGTFDAVVCQFGVMFFPDKSKAFSEARRVLRPGGVFIFNVWDRIEENEFADTVTTALASLFPEDPPRFLARTPHGYHDRRTIERDLASGGFTASPQIDTVAARSRAASAADPGDRVLPGDAAAKRDRGARRLAARRSNRHRGRSDRPAVRAGRRRRWHRRGRDWDGDNPDARLASFGSAPVASEGRRPAHRHGAAAAARACRRRNSRRRTGTTSGCRISAPSEATVKLGQKAETDAEWKAFARRYAKEMSSPSMQPGARPARGAVAHGGFFGRLLLRGRIALPPLGPAPTACRTRSKARVGSAARG